MAFMRHNNNGRRHNNNFNRNRNGGNGGQHQNQGQQGQGNNQRRVNRINHVFESNGPDSRIRGTAQQIVEKYTTMARDANMSGDKVLSLNYLQHAEHYQRLWNEIMEETSAIEREREQQRAQQQAQQPQGDNAQSDNASEGFNSSEQNTQPQQQSHQPQQHRQPREQREPREPRENREPRHQPQPSLRDDDENALPNFLHVPITTKEPVQTTEAPSEKAVAPAKTPRPRRAPAAAAPQSEEN